MQKASDIKVSESANMDVSGSIQMTAEMPVGQDGISGDAETDDPIMNLILQQRYLIVRRLSGDLRTKVQSLGDLSIPCCMVYLALDTHKLDTNK